MSFVEINDLWVRYGSFVAVRGISFAIPKGELFGFIGPNGAGKSSTIKVLATLVKPWKGHAAIGGVDVAADPAAIRYSIGYVPDFFGVYEDLSVREYLHFFAAAYRIPTAKRTGLVKDVLALTDLSGQARCAGRRPVARHEATPIDQPRPCSTIPSCCCSTSWPRAWIRARIEMRELLKLQRLGKTIHHLQPHPARARAAHCTRIGIIEQGKMMAEGPLDEIFRRLRLLRGGRRTCSWSAPTTR